MSAEKTIRTQARMTLKGGWLKAIAALIILLSVFAINDCLISVINLLFFDIDSAELSLLSVLYYLVSFVSSFVFIFLLSPFINGYIRMFYRGATEGKYNFADLFYWFLNGRYGKALSVNISFMLRMLLPTLISYSPVIIFSAVCTYLNISFPLYDPVMFILIVLSTLIDVLWSLRYFLVFTLAVDFEYMSVSQLFRSSKMYMKENTGKVARLLFSFTPWLLLCITVLPVMYVAPYMTQAMCISAKWITRTQLNFNTNQEGYYQNR